MLILENRVLIHRSLLAYPKTLIALHNRAMITGANGLEITDCNENAGYPTLSVHFFDCPSKKGFKPHESSKKVSFQNIMSLTLHA